MEDKLTYFNYGKSYLYVLIFVNLTIRILHHLISAPIIFHDTQTYLNTTYCIWNLDFSNYLGDRPPVYPIVLLLSLIDERFVWIFQSLLGIFNSLIVYSIVKKITGDKIAFFTAIAYSLSFNILFAESALLSETTSIFFLLLTLLTFSKYIDNYKNHFLIQMGLFSSLAVLTRPIMIVLLPSVLLTLYLIYRHNNYSKKIISFQLLHFLTPILIIILGLSFFNKMQVDYFSITTLTGFNLSNHSGAFIEKCQDPEYQQIKEILIDYRDKRGTHRWGAIEAQNMLMKQTGLSYSELSKKLTEMSIQLFLNYPHLYFKSVITSYVNYWAAGNVWDIQKIKPIIVKHVLENLWKIQKIILITLNLFFIITIILQAFYRKSLIISNNPVILLSALIIASSSLFQAMVEYGENTRYKLPFQPLILIFIVKILYDSFQFKILNKTSFIKSYLTTLKEI